MAAGGSAIEVNTYNVDGGFRLPHRDPDQTASSLWNGLKTTLDSIVGGFGFGSDRIPGRAFDPVKAQVSLCNAQRCVAGEDDRFHAVISACGAKNGALALL